MRGRSGLRQLNAVLTILIFVLFFLHGIAGSFRLLDTSVISPAIFARPLVVLCAVHALIGIVLTVDTVRASRDKGRSYVKLNARFWAARVSGLAIAFLIAAHVIQFMVPTYEGAPRVSYFGPASMASALGLVAAIVVHVVCNVEPLALSLGISGRKSHLGVVALALSLVLLFMGFAFICYFITWSVI